MDKDTVLLVWAVGVCLAAVPVGFLSETGDDFAVGLFIALTWPLALPFLAMLSVGMVARNFAENKGWW